MTIANITALSSGRGFRSVFERSAARSGYLLTANDRVAIVALLRNNGTKHAPNPALLKGLLRHKLRVSNCASDPLPADLVRVGALITYMISGEGARSAVLTIGPRPAPRQVVVASLLGATLIGMRKMQKAPLLRGDGQIEVVVVLDVRPPSDATTV